MNVTGGIVVKDVGLNVSAGGLQVLSDGATIKGGLTLVDTGLTVTGKASIGGNLTVSGATELKDSLSVAGASTVKGGLSVKGGLNLTDTGLTVTGGGDADLHALQVLQAIDRRACRQHQVHVLGVEIGDGADVGLGISDELALAVVALHDALCAGETSIELGMAWKF